MYDDIKNLVEAFRDLKVFAAGLTAAVASFLFLALIDNLHLIFSGLRSRDFEMLASLVPSLVAGYPGTVETYVLLANILTAVLVGVNIGLLIHNFSFAGLTAAPGTVIGLSFSGCAACTAGVASVAGASLGVGIMPFGGFEISVLGILMLAGSSIYIVRKSQENTCKI